MFGQKRPFIGHRPVLFHENVESPLGLLRPQRQELERGELIGRGTAFSTLT